MRQFEHHGYYKEYYVNGKFIGKIGCENDGREIGYDGRKTEQIESDIFFSKSRKIKAGQIAVTIIYPLSGRLI